MAAEVPSESIASAAAGDEVAFTQIVARYHDDLVRVAYLVSGDGEVAQDAAQAAWAIAWRKLHTIRDGSRLRPWLVSIAANEARHARRRTARRAITEQPIDGPVGWELASPDGAVDHARRLDLMAALQRLPETDRTIVAMRFGLGMSSEEIGPAVGLRASGARARLARALGRLRKDLTDA